jgi:hypothetical protein
MKTRIMIPLLLPLAMLAAACGSGTSDTGVASLAGDARDSQVSETTVPGPSDEEAVLAYTACLRDEGLDVDDPTVDADGNLRPPRPRGLEGTDQESARAAFDACSHFLADFTFGFDRGDQTERQDQLIEYAACMRENGYDMPDPDFSGSRTPGQGGGGPFGEMNPDDPAFQTAQAACGDIFGGGPGFGGPGFGGPGGPTLGGDGVQG